ncbi:hypothetical protein SDC9_165582 [bioreactor metagenome]|uniref:Uncharacterized protein n=1 Tax=bioreactor metagenome TaxID=1076179 RepID=A0A645G290_9ZZZZ
MHLHHVDQLLKLLFNLLENPFVAAGDDGHLGILRIIGGVHRERYDVVAAAAEQPGYPGENSELVRNQHRNGMGFGYSHFLTLRVVIICSANPVFASTSAFFFRN